MNQETLFREALAKLPRERAELLDTACAGQPQLRVKTGMDSRAVLARFEQERQALALMDHPHIARVFDGGLTPMGQPFFVMELVNGLPLNRFCDQARLTPRQRLELFVPICQAVQHAHQKGIIHRDLKPANILVTLLDAQPVPKVIDFGVAKATAGKLTDESLSTQFGAVLGTLEYMAPEQAGHTGADIDTRADIYSLGVILYELLTGLRPHDAKRMREAALTERIRIIREEEPSKPSTRLSIAESLPSLASLRQTEPRKLMALLRGELDWVVMKCLEKQRERRYETVNALSRDILRYLADEPVEARPPSAGYRLRKFLRRNTGPVLAASLVLLALVGGIIGTSLGMIRADQARAAEAEQRTKAEKARDRTRQALDAMTSSVTGDSLSTQKALSGEQKKFLSQVLTYYQEFAGEKADDEQSRARTSAAAYRVGYIEYRLGRKTESAAAFRLAREGYKQLADDFPTVPLYRQDLANSHNVLGALLTDLGKRPEAEQQHRQALAIREKLVTDFPAVPQYRHELAGSHYNLGKLLSSRGKQPETEQQLRQALAIHLRLADDFPTVPQYRQGLARSHSGLGVMLAGLGKQRPEAEQHYRQALALQQKLAADFPAVPDYRIELGGCCCNFGNLVRDIGRPSESLVWFDKAINTLTAEHQQHPQLVVAKQFLRNSHWGRARAYNHLRKYTDAVKDWDKTIELSPKQEQPRHRASRATARIKAGQVAECVAEVVDLTKTPAWNAGQWYNFACVCAVASGKTEDKKQEYAERAMQLLHKAVKAGWKDAAHMKKDTDLDSLRGRDDFKKLIRELENKPAAGKGKQP